MAPTDATAPSIGNAQAEIDQDRLERAPIAAGEQKIAYGDLAQSKGQVAQAGGNPLVDEVDRLFPLGEKQSVALDITRVVCVLLVSVDHGGTLYGAWNTMYVQAWVLQYLFIICGICFGMSSRPVGGYCLRLAVYFCIGVACNWTAFVAIGKDWKNDMWNVVFQFWFIIGLMGFCLALAPLRSYLIKVTERAGSWTEDSHGTVVNIIIIAAGSITVTLASRLILTPLMQYVFASPLTTWSLSVGKAGLYWALPQTVVDANIFLQNEVGYLELSQINLFIAVAWPKLSAAHSLTGWLLILNTYAHKCFLYRAQEARLLCGFDCATIGLVCYFLGLRHRRVVGTYLVRYWFAVLFCCALLWPPGQFGRFDEHPPMALGERMKDNFLEMGFMLLFLCGMERMVDKQIFEEDQMQWLGWWALLVFLLHKAIHITTPAPWNWFVILAMAPIVWYACRKQKKSDAA